MGCILKGGGGLYSRLVVGAVLLAAGAGSRLGGRPKSLLELGGVPLIRRQLIALSGAGVDEVVVVLGHHAALIEPMVQDFPVTVVRNPRPEDGQVSSLRLGLAALAARLDAVLVALADQPLINAQDIGALIGAYKQRREGSSVLVPRVNGEPGNPVMFSAEVREQILQGDANVGRRQWRERHPEAVADFITDNRRYRVDVDTPGDLERFERETGHCLRWPASSSRRDDSPGAARLGLARALVWALLVGGWLVLGGLGRALMPDWAGGQAAVALWLAALGMAGRRAVSHDIGRAVLRGALMAAAAATAALLWCAVRGHGAPALLAAAACWGVLLVAVSRSAQALCRAGPSRRSHAVLPALAGASMAAWIAGDGASLPGRIDAIAGALLLAGLAAALLLPAPALRPAGTHRADAARGAGLFAPMAVWRHPADWPLHAALLSMLPMMATLSAMGDWCGAALGSAEAVVALHLAAMLLPSCSASGASRATRCRAASLLLGAGLIALWQRPGMAGLMTASLCHAAAWGVAWSTRPQLGAGRMPVVPAAPSRRRWSALAGPAAVLLLGMAMSRAGPAALGATHAALALAGLAGTLLAAVMPWLRTSAQGPARAG